MARRAAEPLGRARQSAAQRSSAAAEDGTERAARAQRLAVGDLCGHRLMRTGLAEEEEEGEGEMNVRIQQRREEVFIL